MLDNNEIPLLENNVCKNEYVNITWLYPFYSIQRDIKYWISNDYKESDDYEKNKKSLIKQLYNIKLTNTSKYKLISNTMDKFYEKCKTNLNHEANKIAIARYIINQESNLAHVIPCTGTIEQHCLHFMINFEFGTMSKKNITKKNDFNNYSNEQDKFILNKFPNLEKLLKLDYIIKIVPYAVCGFEVKDNQISIMNLNKKNVLIFSKMVWSDTNQSAFTHDLFKIYAFLIPDAKNFNIAKDLGILSGVSIDMWFKEIKQLDIFKFRTLYFEQISLNLIIETNSYSKNLIRDIKKKILYDPAIFYLTFVATILSLSGILQIITSFIQLYKN